VRERGAKGSIWALEVGSYTSCRNCIMKSLVTFLVFLNVVRVPKSKMEMAGTCGMCGEEKKCLQDFGRRLKDVGIDGMLRLRGS